MREQIAADQLTRQREMTQRQTAFEKEMRSYISRQIARGISDLAEDQERSAKLTSKANGTAHP